MGDNDTDTRSEVERVLDSAGSGVANHYSVLARKVAEKYGSDSLEAVVAQLYRDDMHGYVNVDENYDDWLSMRRKDLGISLSAAVREAEQLLALRKDLTVTNYVFRASVNALARRVLIEDISLRLFGVPAPESVRAVYTRMLCSLHYKSNWLVRTAGNDQE